MQAVEKRHNCHPSLDSDNIDSPLTPLDRRLEALAAHVIPTTTCSLCKTPKFDAGPSSIASPFADDPSRLSEFHPVLGTTACCRRRVCTPCLSRAIARSIRRDWWHEPAARYWLRCPVADCCAMIPRRYDVDLACVLALLGDPQAHVRVMQYERATLLRSALEAVSPRLTPEALDVAASLHAQLADHGWIRDFFNLSQEFSLAAEPLPVDSRDGKRILIVPVFTGLFVRPGRSAATEGRDGGSLALPTRECGICCETITDIVDGTAQDEERWAEATAGFSGDWAWRVRAFPAPVLLPACAAAHALDVCRPCLARHLAAQLETLGRAGCDRLVCPAPGCGHAYSHDEVRALAEPDTFAAYDRLQLLRNLAEQPNFRWCLRESCGAGQIFDIVAPSRTTGEGAGESEMESRLRHRVACDACGFEICFAHQTRWHEGLSCAEFDTLRANGGDPDDAATRAWLGRNTKPCPGPRCGVPVEKTGGCFHMTCRECHFEFCWECLADWAGIVKRGGPAVERAYDRTGHAAGCFFRSDEAPMPTRLMGNTLEEAVRRYGIH